MDLRVGRGLDRRAMVFADGLPHAQRDTPTSLRQGGRSDQCEEHHGDGGEKLVRTHENLRATPVDDSTLVVADAGGNAGWQAVPTSSGTRQVRVKGPEPPPVDPRGTPPYGAARIRHRGPCGHASACTPRSDRFRSTPGSRSSSCRLVTACRSSKPTSRRSTWTRS